MRSVPIVSAEIPMMWEIAEATSARTVDAMNTVSAGFSDTDLERVVHP